MYEIKISREYKKFKEIIETYFEEKQIELFFKYFDMLIEYNKTINLFTRKRSALIIKHFLDSIFGALKFEDFLEKTSYNVIDVGSGNGLPGVIFSILYPEIEVKLFEKREKKSIFLNLLKRKLSLDNLNIENKEFSNDFFKDNYFIILKGVNPYKIKNNIIEFVKQKKCYYFSNYKVGEKKDIFADYLLPIYNVRHYIIKLREELLSEEDLWEKW